MPESQTRSKRKVKKTQRVRRTNDYTYDYSYWENYDARYDNFDPYEQFDENMAEFDWRSAYDDSTALDYSDIRPFARFPIEDLNYLGTQANDFIVQCTYDGRECSPTQFKRYANPKYGNCFIYNSIFDASRKNGLYSAIRNTSKTGEEFGLKLTLFLDKEEYIGVLSQNSAARVRNQILFYETSKIVHQKVTALANEFQ